MEKTFIDLETQQSGIPELTPLQQFLFDNIFWVHSFWWLLFFLTLITVIFIAFRDAE